MTAESRQPVPLGPAESLASLLWNLHQYYSQFSDCVQSRVAQLRQPIEKELKVGAGPLAAAVVCINQKHNLKQNLPKLHSDDTSALQDFVKISKWNDVSFWSIKQSVEKTHR